MPFPFYFTLPAALWSIWLLALGLRFAFGKLLSFDSTYYLARLHFILLLLSIGLYLIYLCSGIRIGGYWTGRMLFFLALLFSFCLYPLSARDSFSWVNRFYFKAFAFVPGLFLVFLYISFVGKVFGAGLMNNLFLPPDEVLFRDDKVLVLSKTYGVLSTEPEVEIFQRNGYMEKRVELPGSCAHELDSVEVEYHEDTVKMDLFASSSILYNCSDKLECDGTVISSLPEGGFSSYLFPSGSFEYTIEFSPPDLRKIKGDSLFISDLMSQEVTYQWLDCDRGFAPVKGATTNSYVPGSDGNFAVMIEMEGCMDTTECKEVHITRGGDLDSLLSD